MFRLACVAFCFLFLRVWCEDHVGVRLSVEVEADDIAGIGPKILEHRIYTTGPGTNNFTVTFRTDSVIDVIFVKFGEKTARKRIRLNREAYRLSFDNMAPHVNGSRCMLFSFEFVTVDGSVPFDQVPLRYDITAGMLDDNYRVFMERQRPVLEQETDLVGIGDDIAPVWVSLNEFRGEEYIWLAKVKSAYGDQAGCIMGGREPFKGNEFLQLVNFENGLFTLWIPGLSVSGPHFPSDSEGVQIETRHMFRYSTRDACWILWNYKTAKPAYLCHLCGNDAWNDRAPAIAADLPGAMFRTKPR